MGWENIDLIWKIKIKSNEVDVPWLKLMGSWAGSYGGKKHSLKG
jgi:hypothetical protein